jgi:hypothetical protein
MLPGGLSVSLPTGVNRRPSPLLVWMHPKIQRDRARLGQFDHVAPATTSGCIGSDYQPKPAATVPLYRVKWGA